MRFGTGQINSIGLYLNFIVPCFQAEVTQRLANSAEAAQVKKPVSHEDLARQLQVWALITPKFS